VERAALGATPPRLCGMGAPRPCSRSRRVSQMGIAEESPVRMKQPRSDRADVRSLRGSPFLRDLLDGPIKWGRAAHRQATGASEWPSHVAGPVPRIASSAGTR
jgi:hypothetical protein